MVLTCGGTEACVKTCEDGHNATGVYDADGECDAECTACIVNCSGAEIVSVMAGVVFIGGILGWM